MSIFKVQMRALKLTLIFLMAFGAILPAQEDKELLPRVAVRAFIGVPKVVGSQAYRVSFNGLYDGGLKITLRLFNNFCLGVGYQNALFNTTTEFRDVYGRNINTRQQMHNGVLAFQYDKQAGPKSFWSLSLSTGASYNFYTGTVAVKDSMYKNIPTSFTTAFVRPEASINFLVEDNFAFSIFLAYNMTLQQFNPELPRLDGWKNYEKIRNKANMGYISFGFGFYYGFKKKKASA